MMLSVTVVWSLLVVVASGLTGSNYSSVTLSDSCPLGCQCSAEESAEVGRLVKGARCSGPFVTELPLNNLSVSLELLSVNNASVRRFDFFTLRRFQLLLTLDLSRNWINEVTGSGRALPRLKYLDLSSNALHILPAFALRDFPVLYFLNISFNGLHTLAPQAISLPSLGILDLSHNRLAVLKPYYFAEIPQVQDILLTDNAVSRVPALVFGRGTNLRTLDLSRNHILRVEDTAFDGVGITGVLSLAFNALRRLPNTSLKRLANVDSLVLDGNPVRTLGPGAIVGVPVRNLSLSQMRQLFLIHRGSFVHMDHLEELSLSDNAALAYLHPESIISAPKLSRLDLSGSGVFTLEAELLEALPELSWLRLARNHLACHCSLGWLQRLLVEPSENSSRKFKVEGDVLCESEEGENLNLSALSPLASPCLPYIVPLFPSSSQAVVGSNASFTCRAMGSTLDAVKIHWFERKGHRLFNNQCSGRLCVRDHTLTVTFLHTEDAGKYWCEARNSVGATTRSITLHVRDAHIVLVPLTITSTFVTLAWNVSAAVSTGGSYFLRYQREDSGHDSQRSVSFSVGAKIHSYTVHGLHPGQSYTFALCLERDSYSIILSSVHVRTRDQSFLLTVGIERSYLSAILLSVAGGVALAICAGLCGLRLWRRRLKHQGACSCPRSESSLSGRAFLGSSSTSAHSDLAAITYINLAEPGGETTRESHFSSYYS